MLSCCIMVNVGFSVFEASPILGSKIQDICCFIFNKSFCEFPNLKLEIGLHL